MPIVVRSGCSMCYHLTQLIRLFHLQTEKKKSKKKSKDKDRGDYSEKSERKEKKHKHKKSKEKTPNPQQDLLAPSTPDFDYSEYDSI